MIATVPGLRTIVLALVLVLTALPAPGCNPTPSPAGATEPARKDRLMPPQIHCAAAPTYDGRTIVRYEIRNVGPQVIHVLEGQRMPYRLATAANTLEILHGVNPPDPDELYNMIEIPLTRPLGPGESLAGEVVLPTKTLRDHYGEQPTPESLLHGTIQVRCMVGWGSTAITAADRGRLSIQQLVAWQQLTGCDPFNVVLP